MALALLTKLQILTAAADVKVNPDDKALPGVPAAEQLLNGLAKYVLIACVAGGLLGIGQWVLGSRTNNYSQADSGKSKVAIAAGGAFLVGAMATIVNFFVTAGGKVK